MKFSPPHAASVLVVVVVDAGAAAGAVARAARGVAQEDGLLLRALAAGDLAPGRSVSRRCSVWRRVHSAWRCSRISATRPPRAAARRRRRPARASLRCTSRSARSRFCSAITIIFSRWSRAAPGAPPAAARRCALLLAPPLLRLLPPRLERAAHAHPSPIRSLGDQVDAVRRTRHPRPPQRSFDCLAASSAARPLLGVHQLRPHCITIANFRSRQRERARAPRCSPSSRRRERVDERREGGGARCTK